MYQSVECAQILEGKIQAPQEQLQAHLTLD
jgi:hypothetical protein